jgi:hypothetical protein
MSSIVGRPFKKGQSGNPGGRAKGFERRVRDLVDPDQIIKFALNVMINGKETTKDQLAAARFLAERGWGKPRQTVEVVEVTPPEYDYSKLSAKEMDQLEKLLERAQREMDKERA